MTLLHQAAQKAVGAALRRAYSLGQIYWRLADSDSYLKNAKASTTQKQFDALVQETLATIQQQPEPVADGTFWLIERGANQWQSPTMWWSSRPDKVSSYSWVESVHEATRFDSAQAAEAMAQERYVTHYAVTSHSFLEASPPALQHQEEPPPECKTEEEKRAFAFGWWKAMEANRARSTGAYAFGVQEVPREPVDMLLFCPFCGLQHVDAPDERTPDWKNEPHNSHLCHGCGSIWRPADVPTNGVAELKTRGKADTWSLDDAAVPAIRQLAPDGFNGDTPNLVRSITALLKLDAAGAMAGPRMGGHARTLLTAAANRLAASPSTTRQQEVGSVPPAKLVNGQWIGVPLSQFPELQEQVRKGLADGTLSVGGAAAPSTPEKAGGVSEPARGNTTCNPHPDAPHGFNRNASHNAGRYVCDCEGWMPPPPSPIPHPLPAQHNDGGA